MPLDQDTIASQYRDINRAVYRLMLEIREQIASYLPEHTELLKWNTIAFDKPGARNRVKDNICYLRPKARTLEIGFGLGVFLKDCDQLLKGSGRYKRFIELRSIKDYRHQETKDLVLQSYHFNGKQVLYKLLPNDDYQQLKKGI